MQASGSSVRCSPCSVSCPRPKALPKRLPCVISAAGGRNASGSKCSRLLSRSRTAKHPRMPSFRNGKVEIAYLDEGEGEPIVLIHGFASTKEVNWLLTSWFATLTNAGRRAIALDNRGHGASSKLYDPADYHSATMAEDARALLDHLGIDRADIVGYSMGARIAAFLGLAHPRRIRSIVMGGLGSRRVDGVGLPESIAEALEARSLADVQDAQA